MPVTKKKKERKKGKQKKDRHKRKKYSHRPNTSLGATRGTTKTKANRWSISCPCYTVYWPADRAAPHSSDERQAQSMMPKTERHTDTLKQAQRQKVLTRMPTAEKAVKERGCTQMPVAKKERTGHKCLWQRRKD